MATFVLVHGAWLWASAWNRVADLLIAGGHRVVTPWLTGLGEKRDLLSDEVDLNTHVADVAKRLEQDDLTNVVLVGHGYAGMVITGVAELQLDRLSQLVYLDAYVPLAGQSAWDLIPEPLRASFLQDARAAGGGGWRLPPNERYYGVWGLSPGPDRDLLRMNATDFSLPCLRTPLHLPNNNAAKLPRAFIRGTRRYAAQHLFQRFAQTALGDGWPIYEVQAGHVMCVEKPAELAEVLARIANELPPRRSSAMPHADGGLSPANRIQMLNGYQQTCVLLAAFRLAIFDRLAGDAKSATDLAAETGAQPARLERLLRALVAMGLLKKDGEHLSLPAYARSILAGWRDVAVLIDTQYLDAWHALSESVLTGEPAFDRVFGTTVWRHREENPEINRAFNSFGRQFRNDRPLLDACDLSRFATIADLGGGHGDLIASILKRHVHARGILFDQPHVLEHSKVWIEEAGVSARCALQGGSFFDSVPAGADLYILQHVLHDWNDEQCRTILRNCRTGMGAEGTLLIIERVIPAENPPLNLIMLDLHMMAVLGGQERTLREYETLLSEAGLVVRSFRPSSGSAPDIIECGASAGQLPR